MISKVRIKSAIYSISKPIPRNTEIKEKKNELIKNKIDVTKKAWEDKKIKFIDDISISYGKINKPIGNLKYHKVIFLLN